MRCTARCSTRVAPVAASAASSSPGGIGVARAAVRVSTTVWPTPGRVSSWRSAAAAAANAGTPGTICHGTPAASSRRACSATALKIDGSPLCSRTTSCPARCAATSSAMICVEVQVGGVDQPRRRRGVPPAPRRGTRLPGVQHDRRGGDQPLGAHREQVRRARPGADEVHTVIGRRSTCHWVTGSAGRQAVKPPSGSACSTPPGQLRRPRRAATGAAAPRTPR